MKIKYVIGVVVDEKSEFVVGLTKKKGPSFLLNKITFPGGKLEIGETPEIGVAREIHEEIGLVIPAEQWSLYETFETEDYTLYKLVARSDKVLHARQMEEEPVWQLAIASHLKHAKAQPDQYAPDFINTLNRALSATAPHPN
jgi:mutator protein MutT